MVTLELEGGMAFLAAAILTTGGLGYAAVRKMSAERVSLTTVQENKPHLSQTLDDALAVDERIRALSRTRNRTKALTLGRSGPSIKALRGPALRHPGGTR